MTLGGGIPSHSREYTPRNPLQRIYDAFNAANEFLKENSGLDGVIAGYSGEFMPPKPTMLTHNTTGQMGEQEEAHDVNKPIHVGVDHEGEERFPTSPKLQQTGSWKPTSEGGEIRIDPLGVGSIWYPPIYLNDDLGD